MVANQPVSNSPQREVYYQGDHPHHHPKPESAYERICSLQKQIEKVQFETVHPVTSSTYNAPSQSEYYTEGNLVGFDEVSSVDEAARKVYEMALASVEQDGPGTPESHAKRVAALQKELQDTTGMHTAEEGDNAKKAAGFVAAADVLSSANKHSSTAKAADLVLAAHYINDMHSNGPAKDDYSTSSVVHAAQFVGHLQGASKYEENTHRSADEQRRIDHAARVHQLKGLLAASQSNMEPEELIKYKSGDAEGSTRDRLRDLASHHGLSSTTGRYEKPYASPHAPKLPESLGFGVASVVSVAESCPSLYAPKASTRISELKRSMHDIGLGPRGHRMMWSDLDIRSADPREVIRPGNLDISKLSMSALKAGYRQSRT
jgi:hypothetical protein